MIKERGYRNWLKDFLNAMSNEEYTYWMRVGTQPKKDFEWVYFCIKGKIRFKAKYVCSHGPEQKTFLDHRSLNAKAWIVMCSPMHRPHSEIPYKGFRGYRYTEKLF